MANPGTWLAIFAAVLVYLHTKWQDWHRYHTRPGKSDGIAPRKIPRQWPVPNFWNGLASFDAKVETLY